MRACNEIGSEFWDVPIGEKENHLFPSNTKWFRSGRDALGYIIDDICQQQEFRSIALPSWCCESMIMPFLSRGITVKFYSVIPKEGGGLIQNISEANNCDGILLMSYFGYIDQTNEIDFDGIQIHDMTHSLFSGIPADTGHVIGSLRKWAGFITGGFAYKREGDYIRPLLPEDTGYNSLRKLAMEEKRSYIAGEKTEKTFLPLFAQANRMLESTGVSGTSADIKTAKKLDIEYLKTCRRRNAKFLMERLFDFALFRKLDICDCPLFVPILVPDGKRDGLKKHLIEQNIYCPVHWPMSLQHRLNKFTKRVYDEELSIVCDQRYDLVDMERISDKILQYLK